MIGHSESFPYFRVARHFNVPYAAVLHVVELIESPFYSSPLWDTEMDTEVVAAIQKANKREHKRRCDVMRGERLA